MNPAVYKELQREYDLKRARAISESERKKDELLSREPKYSQLVDKKNKLALELTKTVLRTKGIEQQVAKENLEIKLNEVEKEIKQLLNSLNLENEYLLPKYECKRCKDTGYINDNVRCSCFTQKIVNITYKQNNMLKL